MIYQLHYNDNMAPLSNMERHNDMLFGIYADNSIRNGDFFKNRNAIFLEKANNIFCNFSLAS